MCVYTHVLRNADGCFLRGTVDFEIEGQWRKWRLTKMWMKQVEEENIKLGVSREEPLFRSEWFIGVNRIAIRWR